MGLMTTILLVEDDPLEAHLTMSLLGRQSGEVCRVNDAAEALCAVEQPEFAAKLSLVISGSQTKGIGGPTFVSELRERMPGVPVLVVGVAGESQSDYAERVSFLPFPSSPQQVAFLAGQMLGRTKDHVA
jgi:DNA-binding NtrC family response regulator